MLTVSMYSHGSLETATREEDTVERVPTHPYRKDLGTQVNPMFPFL